MTTLRTSPSSSLRLVSKLARDRSGVSAVAFALTAPIALFAIAGAMSYMSALQYQADVQSAADAAALATSTAINASPTANASQIATNYFNANAPASAGTIGSVTIFTGDNANSNTTTTRIDYAGNVPTLLSSSKLGATSLPVNASSTAYAASGSNATGSTSSGSSSSSSSSSSSGGSGSTACEEFCNRIFATFTTSPGSPIAWNFLNNAQIPLASVSCPTSSTGTKWYNMLSDAGIEINFTCASSTYMSGATYASGFSILLTDPSGVQHVVAFSEPAPAYPHTPTIYPAYPNYTVNPSTIWQGQITIDGTTYAAPSGCTGSGAQCNPVFLNGQAREYIALQGEAQPYYNYGENSVTLEQWGYVVSIYFDYFGHANVSVMGGVWNGAQGYQGGFLGQTVAGLIDPNLADFEVSGPTGTTYQYYWTYQGAKPATPNWYTADTY